MPDGAKQAVLDRVLGYARNHTQMTWIGATLGNFEGHTLVHWAIEGNRDSLPPETTDTQVSCFELYLLAMLQAGQAPLKKGQTARQFMDAFFLKVIPNDANLSKKGKPGQGWVDGLRGKKPLTKYDHLHEDGSAKRKAMPSAGQLVFFNGLAHVCMATGSAVTTMVKLAYNVSPEILSFWGPFPDLNEPHVQPTVVYHSTISEMRDYMIATANAGLGHSPTTADQYDIRFADPFWA
jgi:hypothetical protein